jgi:acetyl-CoA carboxylase biotin carboxyl carrier protein
MLVADGNSQTPGPFDLQTVKQLVALMNRNDLTEIDLRVADQRIRLRRGMAIEMSPMSPHVPVSSVPQVPTASGAPAASESAAKSPAKNLKEIKSPLVGTFYSAPKPGAESFVKVGTRVTPATIVGLIEAMKLFNEIPAECAGAVVEVLVENQQPVEFGQVLYLVDPAA